MVNCFIKLVMWFFLKAYSGLKFAHYLFTKFVTPKLKICSFWRLTFQERNCKLSGISWKIHMATFLTSFVDPISQGVFAMKDSNWYQLTNFVVTIIWKFHMRRCFKFQTLVWRKCFYWTSGENSKNYVKKLTIFRLDFHQVENFHWVQCKRDVIGAISPEKIIYLKYITARRASFYLFTNNLFPLVAT